ncbi:MAG: hypothetical protein P0116_14295 [Candidatus Nitrosocosmicus sp.]|nr:hypothetical protein [Candidatus Nitrosocosmicus sp.]
MFTLYSTSSMGSIVHHIAWRTPTDGSQLDMRKIIINTGLDATL